MYIECDMDDRQLLDDEQAQYEAYMGMDDEAYQIELEKQALKEEIRILISEFVSNYLQIYGRFHLPKMNIGTMSERVEDVAKEAFEETIQEVFHREGR